MLTLYLMNSGKPALVINIAEILHTGHSTTTKQINKQTNQRQQYVSQSIKQYMCHADQYAHIVPI